MIHHENRLIYLGKKFGKTHPMVRLSLSRIYRTYLWLACNLFLYRVVICKRIFRYPKLLMVNIGGGHWYKRKWLVLDFKSSWYSWNEACVDVYHDLTERDSLPFGDNSVHLFYTEHTLEHISNEDCHHTLYEVYRCLRSHGAVRIVVPDMDLIYEKYKEGDEQFFELWIEHHKATLTQAFMTTFAVPKKDEGDESIKYNFLTLKKSDFFNFYTHGLRQNPNYAGHHINWFTYLKLERMLNKNLLRK